MKQTIECVLDDCCGDVEIDLTENYSKTVCSECKSKYERIFNTTVFRVHPPTQIIELAPFLKKAAE